MPVIVHPLHPGLRPWVQRCVGYDYWLEPDAVHHGRPSTALTVILAFDEPLDCGWAGERSERRWVLVGGLHTRPAIIRTHGRQCGIQLSLSPVGVRDLLGLPSSALAGELVHGDELGAAFPADLHDRLHAAGWVERFRLLERHLVGLVGRAGRRPSTGVAELDHAWRRLTDAPGAARVAELADELGWSRRHLTERFTREFGVAPKMAARVARFGRATELAPTASSLAEVAAACGYADQAHMTREWREFAGLTPRETMGDLPFVQDDLSA